MPRKTRTTIVPHIRWMIRRDAPEVLAIESASFGASAWVEEDFLVCLRKRNCIGMVAELGDRVIGFMVYELHKDRLEVLNLAVHTDYRRSEVGTAMVSTLIRKLSSHRRPRITLEVRETNLPAQLFFRSCGLRAVRSIRDFYEDTDESAIRMEYLLPGCEPAPEELGVNRIAHLLGDQS